MDQPCPGGTVGSLQDLKIGDRLFNPRLGHLSPTPGELITAMATEFILLSQRSLCWEVPASGLGRLSCRSLVIEIAGKHV